MMEAISYDENMDEENVFTVKSMSGYNIGNNKEIF